MDKKEIISVYSFSTASEKWIPKGGDLLKYVGQEVVFVDFKKQEDGTWTSECKPCKIEWIGNFDPLKMTYQIKYTIFKETREECIIPEGFSFDIAGGGIQNKMCRFIPEHLHMACIEEEQFYERLKVLWDKHDTMPALSLQTISSDKEKHRILNYCKHIAAVAKTDEGEILYFKICGLKLKTIKGGLKEITVLDSEKRTHVFVGAENAKSYDWPGIGKLKIFDLEGK